MKKILINTPSLKKLGGVSNHFSGLKGKWTNDVKYNTIGSRNYIPTIILLPFDLFKFIFKCFIFRPDIVFLNPSLSVNALRRDALFLFIAKYLKIKTCVFFHGWDIKVEKMIDNKEFDFYKRFEKSDLILVLAESFKLKLIKWGFKKNIMLTTTKVDDVLLNNFIIEEKVYDNSLLFLSRVEKNKGIYIVLDTFIQINHSYPKVKLTIAGDGSELDNVKKYISDNKIKNVNVLGRVSGDELINVFKEHSIYLLPTYHGEGMPTSILEAMAFGQVIITRPIGGITDFFEQDKMGYLSKSTDSTFYSNVLFEILSNSNKIKEISIYNHNYSKSRFLASKVAKNLEGLLNKI